MFANVDVADVPVNIKVGQHTVYWGDSLLLGGAVHGMSYSQNPLDIWKGFATPGTEAKELFRPRGGVTLQAQPTKELSIAGQWFYNWQAVRIPESGSYLTIQDAINFGGDSIHLRAEPARDTGQRCAGLPAPVARAGHKACDEFRQPWRLGPVRPLEPGVARRHDGLLLSQHERHGAAADGDARRRSQRSRGDLHGDRRHAASGWPVPCQQERHLGAELQKFGKLGLYNAAYGEDIHIYGISLSKSIGGVSVGAESRTGRTCRCKARRSRCCLRHSSSWCRDRSRRRRCRPAEHRVRSATHGTGSSTPSASSPAPRCSTRRRFPANSRGTSGPRSRRTKRCSRAGAATRRSTRYRRTTSASRSTSRRRGSRYCPAWIC